MSHFLKLGVGTYGLTGVYGKKDIGEYIEGLRYAIERGIGLIDTSNSYDNSEKVIGELIKPVRKNIKIIAKLGADDVSRDRLTSDMIKESCEKSLVNLSTDYIDYYHLHYDNPSSSVEEVINGFETLKSEGKILNYGIGHMKKDRAMEYISKGNVSSMMLEYSAIERKSGDETLSFCKYNNLEAIVFSITGRGLLTGKYNYETKFSKNDIRSIDPLFSKHRILSSQRIIKTLDVIGKEKGKSIVQIAIAWVLHDSRVDYALTGPSRIKHMRENLGSGEIELTKEELSYINDTLKREEYEIDKYEMDKFIQIINKNITDIEAGRKDLIYAVEVGIKREIFQEKEVIPIFFDIYNMSNEFNKMTILNDSRLKLKELIETSI